MKWLKKKIVGDYFGTRDGEEERKIDCENIKTNESEAEGADNGSNDREDVRINDGINVGTKCRQNNWRWSGWKRR